jgi:hypothetical protein
MIELLLATGGGTGLGGFTSRHPPAIVRRVYAEGRPLPNIGALGTGGTESRAYYLNRIGYQQVEVVREISAQVPAPFVDLMEKVQLSFGRTMSRLPEVFGVSRQTLYNWLAGETPREQHQAKIRQLASAALVFKQLGYKPTALALDQTLMSGKSFLQLINSGSDGREAAQKLIKLSTRTSLAKGKLDDLLGGRRAILKESDIGTPTLDGV